MNGSSLLQHAGMSAYHVKHCVSDAELLECLLTHDTQALSSRVNRTVTVFQTLKLFLP